MKKYICLLIMTVALWGCKSSQKAILTLPIPQTVEEPQYLSSRLQLTLPEKVGGQELNGTMKMKQGEMIQISLLMPILRTEILRLEIMPEQVLLIDRLHRRYVMASRDELIRLFRRQASFCELEALLVAASKAEGSTQFRGDDLGFAPFGDAQINFFNFSDKPIDLEPTKLSDRYKQITIDELMLMLQNSI